jgi:2-dehydro-3-deoxyphosphogluconate aldolase/(4S)-4-hydroxy-2-oxoglutarate aldolase
MTVPDAIRTISEDRALTVVRAPDIPDAAALAQALSDGGIRAVELTFTTPDVLRHIAVASGAGFLVGVGTVLTGDQAKQAIDAGARFLVTPGLRPEVAAVASEADVPVLIGALTPTEVQAAVDLGAAAVKIFPAKLFGPGYFKDHARSLSGRTTGSVRRGERIQRGRLPGRGRARRHRRHRRRTAGARHRRLVR